MTTAAPVLSPARSLTGQVGDALQPARYHAVLDDLVALRRRAPARSRPHALAEARALLLSSDGLAGALLSHRCDHDRCWAISGTGGTGTRCLPATVDPVVLVAACLHVCPAFGVVRLRRDGHDTSVAIRWPFDLARAEALVTQAGFAAAGSGPSC